MRRLLILAVAALSMIACSSSDYDQPQPTPRRPGATDDGGYSRARTTSGLLDMLPPAGWWHQPQLAEPLHLTADQFAALDKIAADQADEIARLDRDSMVAVRDLRQVLQSNQPGSADIVTAGQRLRSLRDTLFDRQLQMLVAERAVLTQQQWQTLQTQLQSRPSRMDNGGYPRRGGRGGMGGRGRWPGF